MWGGVPPQAPEEVEALLAAAAGVLAERGSLTARSGAFLSLAIRRLGAASASLHAALPGAPANPIQ